MKADRKHIIVCGNYGASNLGDEAILAGIILLIKSTWPNSEISVMSHTPGKTAKEFQVKGLLFFPAGFRSFFKFWFRPEGWKTLKSAAQADLILLGGGGLFTDEKKRAVWIWFLQFLGFWIFRKPVVCIAQSVGPLSSGLGIKLSKFVFIHSKLVTVRDQQSKIILEKMGVKNVQVLADPAFAIGYDSDPAISRQKQVVLSLRDWIRGDQHKINLELAQLIDFLWKELKLKTIFIPFQNEIDDDRKRYTELAALLANPEAMQLKVVQDYGQAIELIGRSEMTIGMRLHSIIFSVLATTPFIALSYSKKVKDFTESSELNEFCLNYSDLEADKLKALVLHVYKNRERISSRLQSQKLKGTYSFFEHEKLLEKSFN
jgi:polysaccharide pyruvyl transferase CsaB